MQGKSITEWNCISCNMCDISWILGSNIVTYSNHTQNFDNRASEKKKERRQWGREGGTKAKIMMTGLALRKKKKRIPKD